MVGSVGVRVLGYGVCLLLYWGVDVWVLRWGVWLLGWEMLGFCSVWVRGVEVGSVGVRSVRVGVLR